MSFEFRVLPVEIGLDTRQFARKLAVVPDGFEPLHPMILFVGCSAHSHRSRIFAALGHQPPAILPDADLGK